MTERRGTNAHQVHRQEVRPHLRLLRLPEAELLLLVLLLLTGHLPVILS